MATKKQTNSWTEAYDSLVSFEMRSTHDDQSADGKLQEPILHHNDSIEKLTLTVSINIQCGSGTSLPPIWYLPYDVDEKIPFLDDDEMDEEPR